MVSEVTVDGDDADQVDHRTDPQVPVPGADQDGHDRRHFPGRFQRGGHRSPCTEETGIPFCTVTRDRPDIDSMRAALQKHFPDWEDRLSVVERHSSPRSRPSTDQCSLRSPATSIGDMRELMRGSTVLGAIPEPIRMAHLIAAALVKGESKGNP